MGPYITFLDYSRFVRLSFDETESRNLQLQEPLLLHCEAISSPRPLHCDRTPYEVDAYICRQTVRKQIAIKPQTTAVDHKKQFHYVRKDLTNQLFVPILLVQHKPNNP